MGDAWKIPSKIIDHTTGVAFFSFWTVFTHSLLSILECGPPPMWRIFYITKNWAQRLNLYYICSLQEYFILPGIASYEACFATCCLQIQVSSVIWTSPQWLILFVNYFVFSLFSEILLVFTLYFFDTDKKIILVFDILFFLFLFFVNSVCGCCSWFVTAFFFPIIVLYDSCCCFLVMFCFWLCVCFRLWAFGS